MEVVQMRPVMLPDGGNVVSFEVCTNRDFRRSDFLSARHSHSSEDEHKRKHILILKQRVKKFQDQEFKVAKSDPVI